MLSRDLSRDLSRVQAVVELVPIDYIGKLLLL
jgi:hypothetical protein